MSSSNSPLLLDKAPGYRPGKPGRPPLEEPWGSDINDRTFSIDPVGFAQDYPLLVIAACILIVLILILVFAKLRLRREFNQRK